MSVKITKIYNENKLILLFLLLAIIFRLFLPYLSFASTDLDNLMNKYLYLKNEIDIYNISHITVPIPRFPFVIYLFKILGETSDNLNLNLVFLTKYLAVIFEFAVAILVLKIYNLKENKKKSYKFYLLFFLVIILNPLSTYINSFLGFFETLWIFFLLLAVYVFEFESKNIKDFYIPILLAISISIHPISLIIIFYFYYKSSSKSLFLILFLTFFILLNSYFIVGAINNPIKIYYLFENIFYKMLIGNQVGQFGLSELEKLYNLLIGSYSFIIFKYIKIIEFFLYFFIYLVLLNSKKIKSYEFIFIILYLTIIFNDNLHENYLYWIIPFAYILNYKKTSVFSLILCLLVFEDATRTESQILIFNYINFFDFFHLPNEFIQRNYNTLQIFINVILFYGAIIILYNKKLFKKIYIPKINIIGEFKKITLNSLEFKKIKIFSLKKILSNGYGLIIVPFMIIIIFNHQFLTNITTKNNYNFNNLKVPTSINKFFSHGNNTEYSAIIKANDNAPKTEIIFVTGYFSSLFINGEKISMERNILHFINDRWKHEKKLNSYPLKKINITQFLKNGDNTIRILSNTPHTIKDFGLVFYIIENDELIKKTNDLSWSVKINQKRVDYKFIDYNENIYLIDDAKLFAHYKKIDKAIKILELNYSEKKIFINPYNFLSYIFIILSILFLLCVFSLKKRT